MNNRQYTDKENAKKLFRAFNKVYRTGKPGKGYDYEIIKKDGIKSYVESSISLRKDSSGKAIGFRGIIRDITDRKQAEKVVRDSEERFRTLVENASEGIFVQTDYRFAYINSAMLRIFGAERPEQLLGQSVMDRFHPDFGERVRERIRLLNEEKKSVPTLEQIYLRLDGSQVQVEVSAAPIVYNEKNGAVVFVRDITERKRLQETLDKDRNDLKLIIDSSPIIVFYKDKEGRFIRVSKAFAEALKIPEEDFVGKTVFDLYSPKIAQGMADDDKEVFQSRRPKLNIVEKYESSSGIRWAQTDKIPIFDKHGLPIGLIGFAQDITDRKQSEESLRESEEKMKSIFRAAPIGIGVVANRILMDVNTGICEMTGYSREELIGSSARVLYPTQDDFEYVGREKYRQIDEKGTGSVETRWMKKNGTIIDILLSSTPIDLSDRSRGVTFTALDITERKKAEVALRESEEKYRDLVENISDIIYATDESGIVTYISPTIEFISGYAASEIVGRSFLEFVYKEDMSDVVQLFQQDISGQAVPHEYRMVTKSGDVRWARTSSRPFFEGDRIVGLRGILTDITARKQAEEEVKRGYEQLQETLHSTVKALASTVEMKDQYTAGHQPRVTQLACAIAEEMGLSEDQIEGIRMAASIHDIGKIMVPAEILNKPGPLSEIQYEMIKMHPRAGYDILKGLNLPWPVAQIILQHHERLDGSGYPQGLSGEEIMVEARILGVANVVEAMNAHRPYRPAYDIKEALAEISKNRGAFYDATVVDACLRLFTEKGFTLAPVSR